MESVQNATSLSKLVKICKYGVWVTVIAVAICAVILVGYLAELALWISDPFMTIVPMDHDGTLIEIVREIVTVAACLVGCVMLYMICETISREGVPFRRENVRSTRIIAFICILTFLLGLAIQTILIIALDPEIYVFDFPYQTLFLGVFTYIFSLLIEYGTVLQTESDEFL